MEKEQAIDLLDNLIGMIEDNQDNDYDTAFRMAIEALKAQLSREGTTFDLIDRQQAIDGKISIQLANGVEIYSDEAVPVEYLKNLPPAQPEQSISEWQKDFREYINMLNIPRDDYKGIMEYINEVPTIQLELTDEQAIVHLQSSGWMYRHDKEIYESGLKEQLADDSGSYDSLLPTVHPELDPEKLVRTIETGITATNSNDAYSLGMRNGMRWCKSLIDGVEPKFEGMEGADT